MFATIRNVDSETLRRKDLKYSTHDLCLAQISHLSLVQIIHALVALQLDAGIICTSDLWEIQNKLLIICDTLRLSSHNIVWYFLPATGHQWSILNPYVAKSQYRCTILASLPSRDWISLLISRILLEYLIKKNHFLFLTPTCRHSNSLVWWYYS